VGIFKRVDVVHKSGLKQTVGGRYRKAPLLLSMTAALIAGMPVHATVIDTPDVVIGTNSFRTFQDVSTGKIWLDLDNFFGSSYSYNSVVTLLSGTQFHVATLSDMNALQASIPAVPANFAAEVVIVGGNYLGSPYANGTRSLMYGVYDDGGLGAPTYASDFFRYSTTTISWGQNIDSLRTDLPLSFLAPDVGVFVVGPTQPFPEPETYAMMLAGLGLLGFAARRRKQPAA
jgi:hypothetical protein